ncbi:MAG: hypothetical protein ACRDHW_13725, partial [Ktedonobacteraceae bacterium]
PPTPPPTPPTSEKITRVGVPVEERGPLDDLDDQSESLSGNAVQDTSLGLSVQMVQWSTLYDFEVGQQVVTPEGRGQVVRVTNLGVYVSIGEQTKRFMTTAQLARIKVLQE